MSRSRGRSRGLLPAWACTPAGPLGTWRARCLPHRDLIQQNHRHVPARSARRIIAAQMNSDPLMHPQTLRGATHSVFLMICGIWQHLDRLEAFAFPLDPVVDTVVEIQCWLGLEVEQIGTV